MHAGLLWLAAALSTASAQETIDLGRLSDDDITVVQKILYPKANRSEIGVHLGLMPFDAFVLTPQAQFSYDLHKQESMAVSLLAGVGYGIQNLTARRLQTPTYGVAPFAYRYLGSVLAGVQWAPIYAKLNMGGAQVIHFDVYLAGRGGITLEQSVLPDRSFALGPTVSPALGARFFLDDTTALRVELRDDVLLEKRALTQRWHLKQNAGVTVGITKLSARAPR